MITAANIPQRFKRSLRPHPATHMFTVGQAVRLKGGLWPSGNIYLVTAKLPPSGDSPQYHIRNETEKFERMARQANLELVSPSTDGESATLIEKSFGLGRGT